MKLTLTLAASALSLLATPALSQSTDFETTGLGAPTVSGNAVGSDYSNLGMTFDGAQYFTCGGQCPDPSFGHFISSPGSDPFTVMFASPVSNFSAVNIKLSSVVVTAYDASDNVLGTDTSNTDQFNFDTISFAFGNISRITFAANPNVERGFGVDNFAFNSELPEPATWAMMLIGFGAIAIALRRKRQIRSFLNSPC